MMQEPENNIQEVIVYIHGITPSPIVSDHSALYTELHNGIAAQVEQESPWRTAKTCFIEWGWQRADDPNAAAHQRLALAQNQLAERMLLARSQVRDWTLNPYYWLLRMALRLLQPLLLYGFPDVLYYVSRDGKNSVRQSVAEQMIGRIGLSELADDSPPISLTFVGHSAGSLVAFDLTFYLFYRAGEHLFLESTSRAEVISALRRLRAFAQRGRLRIRRLITLGSPISLVPYRSNAVVKLLADGRRLDPRWHGLTENPPAFGPPLAGARWINIWDRDDPIAWPVQPLMDQADQAVQDISVDVSDSVAHAHNTYWHSPTVHKLIAQRW